MNTSHGVEHVRHELGACTVHRVKLFGRCCGVAYSDAYSPLDQFSGRLRRSWYFWAKGHEADPVGQLLDEGRL